MRRTLVRLIGVTLLAVSPCAAQSVRSSASAPSPFATITDFATQERALYDASRRAPRDPGARAALGVWLASRGQLKSGSVLLEEARLFGGDAAAIAARLAHIYTWLRDWPSLAALPSSPLSPGERARATLLAMRTTEVVGPDSVEVPFAPQEVGALGRLQLVIGGDTVWAEVDAQEEGLVLPGLRRGAGLVEVIGEDRRGLLGILTECSLGAMMLRQVPMRVDATLGDGRVRMGFDVFAMFAPTVDARAGVVTLRRTGRIAEPDLANALPLLLGFPGVWLTPREGAAPVPIASPAGRAALRGQVWTVDVRRGAIWAEARR